MFFLIKTFEVHNFLIFVRNKFLKEFCSLWFVWEHKIIVIWHVDIIIIIIINVIIMIRDVIIVIMLNAVMSQSGECPPLYNQHVGLKNGVIHSR